MRVLFDEQLSSRLPRLLSDEYPDSLHVESLGLAGAADNVIWRAAIDHGCLLVSKDEESRSSSWARIKRPDIDAVASGRDSVRQFDMSHSVLFTRSYAVMRSVTPDWVDSLSPRSCDGGEGARYAAVPAPFWPI
jgi:predicted nuclease of predicted toxin-antitoxin system